MNIQKVKKRFLYHGIELLICEVLEPYMNGEREMLMTRVIAPNGGTIPIQLKHKQTLKSIVEDTTRLLDNFGRRSSLEEVLIELTKELNC